MATISGNPEAKRRSADLGQIPEVLRTFDAAKQDQLHSFTEEQAEKLYDTLFWDNVKKEKLPNTMTGLSIIQPNL